MNSYRARLSADSESVPASSDKIPALPRRMKEKGTALDATLFIFNGFAQGAQPRPACAA